MYTIPRIYARTAAFWLWLVFVIATMPAGATPVRLANPSMAADFDAYYGTVAGLQNTKLFLRLRTGRVIAVDASRAFENQMTVLLNPGRPVVLHGKVGGDGVLHVMAIWRENASPEFWPPDGPLAPIRR